MDPELTLAKTMKLVRQKEAVQQHNTQWQNSSDTKSPIDLSPIDKKHSSIKGARSVRHKGDGRGTWLPGKSTPKPCTWCGRCSHPISTQCPASGATCKRCMRKGHYASQCFSKTVKLPTKIVHNLIDISPVDLISVTSNTSGHDQRFHHIYARTNQYSNSFFPRSINCGIHSHLT